MHAPLFLRELVVVFGTAVVVVLVLSRFRLPTIAGFIVAGALLGPGGLALVDDPDRIAGLAEAGVVLYLAGDRLADAVALLERGPDALPD